MQHHGANASVHALVRAFALAVVYATGSVSADAQPVVASVDLSASSVPRYGRIELTVGLHAQFDNPYDPADVRLVGEFTAPGGAITRVDGFRYQPFRAVGGPDGPPVWKVRFSPDAPGAWTVRVTCVDATGASTSGPRPFAVTPSSSRGFVRTATGSALHFDDGRTFFAVGENICWWQSDPVGDYTRWIDRLAAHGGNFIRIWMASWSFAQEWNDTGLGDYDRRQLQAHYLDRVLDYAESRGVYVQLCLLNHGQFSRQTNPEWAANPYNAANGGPCQSPWEFFTNETAKRLLERRLRYVVARWGASPALLSWELFNEVDLTEGYASRRAAVATWHREMAAFLKSVDPQRHLVTTSYAFYPGDPAVWADASVDYAQVHHYDTSPDQAFGLSAQMRDLAAATGKPVIVGEFGFPDPESSVRNDPSGVNLHNAMWATAFSGGFGAAATWWWESYVDPQDLYPVFGPLSRLAGRVFERSGPIVVAPAAVRTATRGDLAIVPGLGAFVRPPESAFRIHPDGTLAPSEATLCRFLYANAYHPELFNPPTFELTAPVAGRFEVRTGGEAGQSPRVVIVVDGVTVLDEAAEVSHVYSVPLAAGRHTVLVTNTGLDWITIDAFVVSNFAPAARGLVARGPEVTAGWIVNRAYTWQAVREGTPTAVTDAVVRVDGLADGDYAVTWRSCRTGGTLALSTARTIGGAVELAVPPLAWDLSFELTRGAPPTDGSAPTVTGVSLSKKKVVRRVDPTVDVRWQATDETGVVSATLEFAPDGVTFVPVVDFVPASATAKRWRVPSSLKKTKAGRLRVVAFDAAGNPGVSAAVPLRIK